MQRRLRRPYNDMGKRAVVSAAHAAKALRNPGTSVRQAAEDAGTSRAAMRRAAARLTLPEEAYRTVTFGEYCIAIASVPVLLQQMCLQVRDLGDALSSLQTQAAEQPLNLALSFDETTAGNVLAPDPQKKSRLVYACIKELGTQSTALCLPLCVIGSETMKRSLQNSLGPVLRHILRFAVEDKLAEGFLIQLLD